MAFGAELKDFADGFKIGRGVVEDSLDRKERKEERADAKSWREEGRAIDESRYATTLERQIAQDKRQADRDASSDARADRNEDWVRTRAGVTDEQAAQSLSEEREYRRRAELRAEEALRLRGTGKTPDNIEVDPSDVPEGSTAIDPGTTSSVDKISSNYNPEWLEYANSGATRSQPLSSKLVSALDQVVPQLGVKVRVFSGGQDSDGPNRTGSHRHDHGNAGDIFLEKGGRQLSWENPRDRPIFEQFVKLSKQAGLTGFGAGDGYMQPGSMHVGFGNPGVWGAGGSGRKAPPWLVAAYGGDPGPTHGPGLAALTTHRRDTQTAAAGYAHGGLVKGFSLGGAAIDDGEDQYEPTPIPVAMLGGSDQPQQEQPQQVAEAIPTNVPTPTPRPEYGGDGVVTSQGNDGPPADEEKTDDPYELGRRSVRDGLKRAIADAGANDNGAIADPKSDDAYRKYLQGFGAAPRDIVQQALDAVDPEKKMAKGERNLAALGQVYKHYMDKNEPEKAVKAASSMVQWYRQESNRYLALSQAAAQGGNLDAAAKAAVAAYTNIPNGRDLKITPKGENGAGGFEIKVTDTNGKVITKKVVNPQEFAAAAIGFNPSTFDDEILNAAGAKPEKFDDLSPENRSKVDQNLTDLTGNITDEKITGNPNMMSAIKHMASSIAGVAQNDIGAEPALKIATAIASSAPKSKDNPDGYEIHKIAQHPERVRVTVDGQTVVINKNALADLQKTNTVMAGEAKKAKEESDKSDAKYKAAGELFDKARGQFGEAVAPYMPQSAPENFDPATADTPQAARRRTLAATPEAVPTASAPAAPQDINTMDTPGAARIRTRAATPEAIPQEVTPPTRTAPSPDMRESSLDAFTSGDPGAVAIPDGGPQGDFKGLVEKGNIDLNKRPKVSNPDGSVSTVRSITVTDDTGKAILIPTVSPSGTVLTNEGAINLYQKTGQHLGVFDNEKDAEAYAQALHQSQAARYAP